MSLEIIKVEIPKYELRVDNSTPLKRIDFSSLLIKYHYFDWSDLAGILRIDDWFEAYVYNPNIGMREIVLMQRLFNAAYFDCLEDKCKNYRLIGDKHIAYLDVMEVSKLILGVYKLVAFPTKDDLDLCKSLGLFKEGE